jgi:prenyltransferase beta subunit
MRSTPRRLVLALALAALGATVAAAQPASAAATPVSRALTYLRSHQSLAGGFYVGSSAEQPYMTPWCIMAIAAAGQSPTAWHRPGGRNPIAYLQTLDLRRLAESMSGSSANAAAFYAKLILAYHAAGQSSLIARAGKYRIDLVVRLLAFQDASGRFAANGAEVNTTTWAILALKAAGRAATQRARAVVWLKTHAAPNGGFSWNQGGAPDTDSTAAAVQALRAGGVASSSTVIRRALSYLHTKQAANGGFISGFGSSANAESTAWTVQAIVAAGQNPAAIAWRKTGKSPLDYLLSLQAPAGAFYHFGRILSAPLLTTSEAIIALQRRPFPL